MTSLQFLEEGGNREQVDEAAWVFLAPKIQFLFGRRSFFCVVAI